MGKRGFPENGKGNLLRKITLGILLPKNIFTQISLFNTFTKFTLLCLQYKEKKHYIYIANTSIQNFLRIITIWYVRVESIFRCPESEEKACWYSLSNERDLQTWDGATEMTFISTGTFDFFLPAVCTNNRVLNLFKEPSL